jgi:hypothetical protein
LEAAVSAPTKSSAKANGAAHPARPAGRKLTIAEAHQRVSARFPKTLAELAK